LSTLKVVITSTRPGRIGGSIGRWFAAAARAHGGFDAVELLDLADLDLPIFDEPHHPRLGQYENAHTLAWSEAIHGADAVVFVHPEYNHFPPPSLVNAIDYLHAEWTGKPVAWVSYGGASGGGFARELIGKLADFVSMRSADSSFGITFPMKTIADGVFTPEQETIDSARAVVGELAQLAARHDAEVAA